VTAAADFAVVIAALAACVALWYARETTKIARSTLTEATKVHAIEKADRDAELEERRLQFNADLGMRRVDQVQRVLEVAIDLRQRSTEADELSMQVDHLLPPLGAKLTVGLDALAALGITVPDELRALADGAEHGTQGPTQLRGLANSGIKALVETLRALPPAAPLDQPSRPA
jgi:hypothetical protein